MHDAFREGFVKSASLGELIASHPKTTGVLVRGAQGALVGGAAGALGGAITAPEGQRAQTARDMGLVAGIMGGLTGGASGYRAGESAAKVLRPRPDTRASGALHVINRRADLPLKTQAIASLGGGAIGGLARRANQEG